MAKNSNSSFSSLKQFLSTTVGQITFISVVFFLVAYLILLSFRGTPRRSQQDSMIDDAQVISIHEERELREVMDSYYGKTGVSLSYHVAELDPQPVRVGPNTFTIGISTRRGEAYFRVPRGLKPFLKKSTEETIADLETRFALCLELDIDRKYAHCLKDSMIAIEALTGELEEPLKLQSK